jgi:hypothetical protein
MRKNTANKAAIKHGMSQIKAVIGSPQIKELLANQQLPTPLRKQLERPRFDSDSDSSTGSGKGLANEELREKFKAMFSELDMTKEQLSVEASKRVEADAKRVEADAKRVEADAKRVEAEEKLKAERVEAEEKLKAERLEAEEKLKAEASKRLEAEERAAKLEARLAALEGRL